MRRLIEKCMNNQKYSPSKSFLLWMIVGFIIFIALIGSFTMLARGFVCNIDLESLAMLSEQLNFSDTGLTASGNDAQMYLKVDKDMVINYIDISVKDLSTQTVNAKLYYADLEYDFNERDSVSFYLNEGFNEIKAPIGSKKYLRLDIWGGSFTLDKIAFSSTVNLAYQITQGLFFFMFIWCTMYLVATKFGIRYTNAYNGTIMLLEGLFAVLFVIIMLFAIGEMRYRLVECILIPFIVFVIAMLYTRIPLTYKNRKIIGVLLVVMTAIMCVVGYKMLSTPLNDLGTIYYSAWEIATSGRINTVYTGQEVHRWFWEESNNNYFVRYHNNIPLLSVFAVYYRILLALGLGAADLMSNYMSVLLNIVFIMVAVIFGSLTAKNLFRERGMLVYLIISALFVPYYINACRFYTDTMSIPFVSLILWVYTSEDKKFKSPYVKYAITGVLLGIGALIKGNIPVILVAILLHLLLINIKNIRFVLMLIIIVIGINSAWGMYIEKCSWIDMSNNDALQFPLTHFIMMGINRESNGRYSQADFEYSDQYMTKAEKQKANCEMIKRRIVEFGSLGELGNYEFSKAASTWFDGQYMQDLHISWGIEKGKLYDFLIVGRKYNNLFKIYTQIFTFCMHIFVIAGALLRVKKPKCDYALFLRLIVLGTIAFFVIWETNPRYLLNFTPVFMLASIYGAEELRFFCQRHCANVERRITTHS